MARRASKHQTVTLCMIVKDEAEVITRAFNSVKHIVDYYCICDTGSTDNTVQVIRDYLKENNLKGRVHQRPWVNFGHNRTECLQLASGISDYNMTLDADEVFCPYVDGNLKVTSIVKSLPKFKTDKVEVTTRYGRIKYQRVQFVKDALGFKWYQPLHEYVHSPNASSVSTLDNVAVYPTQDGARARDKNRYAKDALVFEEWLLDNPEDGRAWFYLSQSYRDSKQYKKALESIEKVIQYSGWDEEIFESLLRKARLKMMLHQLEVKQAIPNEKSLEKLVGYFLTAYQYRPTRAEPLHDILQIYRVCGQFHLAVMVGEVAVKIPVPASESLFVEPDIYDFRIKDELSLAYFYIDRIEDSKKLTQELLDSSMTPEKEKDRLRENIRLCEEKLNG